MPRLVPVSRLELVRRFRGLGFSGPFSGGTHPFMVREDITVTIPNPHEGDFSVDLLARILRQAGVTREAWLSSR